MIWKLEYLLSSVVIIKSDHNARFEQQFQWARSILWNILINLDPWAPPSDLWLPRTRCCKGYHPPQKSPWSLVLFGHHRSMRGETVGVSTQSRINTDPIWPHVNLLETRLKNDSSHLTARYGRFEKSKLYLSTITSQWMHLSCFVWRFKY